MSNGFRVHQLSLQFFKGFTQKQTVAIGGRHLFILGPNGFGKSSVIEGIRWGLFGQTGRPRDTVFNQNVNGDCIVELDLTSQGRRYRLNRSLTPMRSVATLHDEEGNEVPTSDVLPTSLSVDGGEGVHLIMIPQPGESRRPVQDMKPFERSIYSHLGLLEVRDLVLRLRPFRWETVPQAEQNVSQAVQAARSEIEEQIVQLGEVQQRLLQQIVPADGVLPTPTASKGHITQFITEMAALSQAPAGEIGLDSLDSLVQEARQLVADAKNLDPEDVSGRIVNLQAKSSELLGLIVVLDDLMTRREANAAALVKAEAEYAERAKDQAPSELRGHVEFSKAAITQQQARMHLLNDVRLYIDNVAAAHLSDHCPVCDSPIAWDGFRDQLDAKLESAGLDQDRAKTAAHELQGELDVVLRLSMQRAQSKEQLERFDELIARQIAELRERHGLDGVEAARGKAQLLDEQLEALKGLDSQRREQHRDWDRALQQFVAERDYHTNARKFQDVKAKLTEVERIEAEVCGSIVRLGDRTGTILSELESHLSNSLAQQLPGLNERLTRIFNALTDQPVFGRVVIEHTKAGSDELIPRVASKSKPDLLKDASQVLNGQSLGALQLVPHFAFADLDDSPQRLALVMLDDPTQAFDEEHIELLLKTLADVGRHVQLIVATHEMREVRTLLPKYFRDDEYELISVVGFTEEDGPRLVRGSGHL